MLFADAEGFWKSPDATGVTGIILAVASIWATWWLARQDIRKRIAEAEARASRAARDEVRRVARALLQTGVAATVRSLELAREACNGRRWPRAVELCILAREQLARVLAQPTADESIQSDLRDVSAVLQTCVGKLREQPKTGAGDVPEAVLNGLDDSILALHRVEGRMTGIRPEADHGQ